MAYHKYLQPGKTRMGKLRKPTELKLPSEFDAKGGKAPKKAEL